MIRQRLFFFLFFLSLTASANAGLFGPSTYEECVLENMKGVSSDVAADAVKRACRSKYSKKSNSQNYIYYKKCEDLAKKARARFREDYPWKMRVNPDADLFYDPPEYKKCIEECEESGYLSKKFGECKTE